MSDRDPVRLTLGGKPFSNQTQTTPESGEIRRNRCAQCGRPFGLTRRHRAGKQFCSTRCMTEYKGSARRERARSNWFDFFTQHP